MLQYGKEMNKTCVFTDFYGQFQSEDEQQINRKARQRKTPALEGKCWWEKVAVHSHTNGGIVFHGSWCKVTKM